MVILNRCCLILVTLFLFSCTYTVIENEKGELQRSVSFLQSSNPSSDLATPTDGSKKNSSGLLKKTESKNIFYMPAIFGKHPEVFTKNNFIKCILDNNDKFDFELVLAANFNKEKEEIYTLDLVVEKELFPYEFSLLDELTVFLGDDSFKLKSRDVTVITKTMNSSRVIDNEEIKENSSRYFKAVTFVVTKEEMDRIILAEKIHLSLNFSKSKCVLNADLGQVNFDIIREFSQMIDRDL